MPGATPPLRVATLALAFALIAALAGCGSAKRSTTGAGAPQSAGYAGAVANPPFPAKPLSLTDYRGRPARLAGYRGKAVLVTFIYTHCPDVCPLIVAHLHAAQAELGAAASKLQIVAVSTDPRGDTPQTVTAFLRDHQMLGRMDYLIGSRAQLGQVWKAWGIAAHPDTATPDRVEHTALVYGIDASGNVRTLYPSNFKPSDIVQDVPKLAAQ